MTSWIVVAGGAGFLGSHLGERLLTDGHRVLAVDDISTGRWANVEHLRASHGTAFATLQHDIRTDPTEAIADATNSEPIEAVVNMASPASPPAYLSRPIETLEIGSVGTQNLIKVALTHDARFLQASTSEIYGDPSVHPQPETYWGNVNPIGPRAVYDEAKRYGEAICAAYERHHGLNLRLLRIFNTYGPRMQADDGRVVTNFVNQALAGKPLTMYGDGSQTRSFCYVDDLIAGINGLLWSEHRGPMNIGNPVEFTMLELAEVVLKATGSTSEIVRHELPEDDPTQRQPDITVARRVLGWEPKVPLVEGIDHTVRYFRSIAEDALAI